MAQAIRNAIRANRFARIDSRESCAIQIPVFTARHADSRESLEFAIRACESIRANHTTNGGGYPWVFFAFLGRDAGSAENPFATSPFCPAKSKRGREEGDGTENVINCRKLS